MANKSSLWQNAFYKVCIITVMALLMLIPLGLIRKQANDRSDNYSESVRDITRSWGSSQTLAGPWISYSYTKVVKGEKEEKQEETVYAELIPDSLKYVVNTVSRELHRSIYDVSVYTADITVKGAFILDAGIMKADKVELILNMKDFKGLQGRPSVQLGGKALKVKSGLSNNQGKSYGKGIIAEVKLDKGAKAGDSIPFAVSLKFNGSESLFFKPLGCMTEVQMTSDYPDPSFSGEYLPVERDVRPDGFTAMWLVSQITTPSADEFSPEWLVSQLIASGSEENGFGVRMVKPVTQYRQTERATKYGLLIIFLVFIAGIVVEIVSKKQINIIQYLVIGASLVLFYSLLLAFADFLSFGVAYLIASVMTTAALCGYFVGIVKNKWAFLLTGLVALEYGIIYVLLQMETYAFLAGTLLLFLILCIIMFLTRNLKMNDPKLVPDDPQS